MARACGRQDVAAGLLASAAEGARAQGRLGHLPRMLVLHAVVAALRGEWDLAVPAGEEARQLATELGEPLWIAASETVLSVVAGMRGDPDTAERHAAQAEQLGRAAGSNVSVALAQFGRVRAALGESRQELQIAKLAAEGLSNREIGQRLYLSHRTNLYRVYPKLGITARNELRAALSSPST